MKKKKSSQSLSLNKKVRSSSFDKSIKFQLGSLLKISQDKIRRKHQTTKNSLHHQLGKSTRITSLNSCQTSQLLCKKTSNQKYRLTKEGYPKKKSKPQKKGNNVSQKIKTNQFLVKRSKNNQPRKSSKMVGKNFEFSKIYEENKWRKALKKNFVFTRCQQIKNVSKLQSIEQIRQAIKQLQVESNSGSKSFLKEALEGDGRRQDGLFDKNRVLVVDWIYLISASLSLNRQTVHLAVHYLDSYIENNLEIQKLITIAAASLFLAVKQQEHQNQNSLLEIMCLSEKMQIQKEEIIEMERKILLCLNFKLKANTLPFWVDYFSLKWDKFVQKSQHQPKFLQMWTLTQFLIEVRSSSGSSYKYYKELVQLADISVLLGDYRKYEKSKLALSCLYLILRIELEREEEERVEGSEMDDDKFKSYQKQFMKKATPIFRDPLRFNQIFNYFLTQLCEYEITQIIPSIKFVAQFLDLNFSYSIDQKSFDESQSYEQFIRKMTYSPDMKLYSLQKLER